MLKAKINLNIVTGMVTTIGLDTIGLDTYYMAGRSQWAQSCYSQLNDLHHCSLRPTFILTDPMLSNTGEAVGSPTTRGKSYLRARYWLSSCA